MDGEGSFLPVLNELLLQLPSDRSGLWNSALFVKLTLGEQAEPKTTPALEVSAPANTLRCVASRFFVELDGVIPVLFLGLLLGLFLFGGLDRLARKLWCLLNSNTKCPLSTLTLKKHVIVLPGIDHDLFGARANEQAVAGGTAGLQVFAGERDLAARQVAEALTGRLEVSSDSSQAPFRRTDGSYAENGAAGLRLDPHVALGVFDAMMLELFG